MKATKVESPFLCLKTPLGIEEFLCERKLYTTYVRPHFEYAIPVEDARAMLPLCDGPLIEKTRHLIPHEVNVWEVDVFHGENQGLTVAEIELADEGRDVSLPEWAGREVTGDIRYYNSTLSRHPFSEWKADEKNGL
jgi:adenylate cyclase